MHGTQLRAGYASEEITPEQSVPMGGYGRADRHSTGTRDRLAARTLVLADGATRVAVVSADLINVSRELSAGVARDLAGRDGVAVDELVLAATHTHSGPYVPARAMDVNPSFAPLAEATDPETVDRIRAGIADSIAAACRGLEPATLRVGRASNATTPVNRRANGFGVRVQIDDTIDPELVVVLVETGGRDLALFNFACHPVCQTPEQTRLSADWLATVYDCVPADHGAEPIFLNGAAGQINPRDRGITRETDEAVYEYTREVGAEIAATVGEAIGAARESDPIEGAPVSADRHELRLPVKSVPDGDSLEQYHRELQQARSADEDTEDSPVNTSVNPRYVAELRSIADWDAQRLPATMQYVEIGPVGIVTVPGEAFVQHGLAFKQRATADTLLVAGYANGYVGYLPTLGELENNGYEVNTTKVAPEAIVAFRERGLELASDESHKSNAWLRR